MRTVSTAKLDVLDAKKFDVHLRLEAENSTGGKVNLSALSSADWVEAVRWDWDLDQPVAQLTADIRRDHSTGESLAPLRGDSTFNLNSTSGFAALIYPGAGLDVYTAVTTAGAAAPATSEYDHVFQGEIDEVAWESSPIQVVARSRNMAQLVDRWLESSSAVYGSSSGDLIAGVIQEVLGDWTDLSTDVLLSTDPAFLISPAYNPDKQQVLQAVTSLSQLIGWNLNEVWSTASTSWGIKFSEPNRTATSSEIDHEFGPDKYYGVRRMSVDRVDVRNVVNVIYGPTSSRANVLVQSTSSIGSYGRRWMEIEEASNSAIDSSSEANTLASAALSDLKEPKATHEIELPYWYPAEIGDYYGFTANEVHYSEDQFLAVYGVSHELSRDKHRSRIRVRGQPAGHRLQWLQYRHGGNVVFAEVLSVAPTFDEDAELILSLTATLGVAVAIYVTVGVGTEPADPTASVNDGSLSGAGGVLLTGVHVDPGESVVIKAVAADAAGVLGPVVRSETSRRVSAFHFDSTDRTYAEDSLGDVFAVEVPGGTLGSNGSVQFKASVQHTRAGTTEGDNHGVAIYLVSSGGTPFLGISRSIFDSTQTLVDVTISRGPTSTHLNFSGRYYYTSPSQDKSVEAQTASYSPFDSTDAVFITMKANMPTTDDSITVDWSLASYLGTP